MAKRDKKMIKALSMVSKQRAMELELVKSDALRANYILQEAEDSYNRAKTRVEDLETSVRDTFNNQSAFSVQELMLQREYLVAKREDLSDAKKNHGMAMKVRDEIIESLKSANQQLELVDRMKDKKIKQHSTSVQKKIALSNDELCTTNRRS